MIAAAAHYRRAVDPDSAAALDVDVYANLPLPETA
jgi:hypothetical protein